MDDELMVRHWNDVERWLCGEAAACLQDRVVPKTVLVAFHRRRTALVVEGPVFYDESADAITDVLCSVIHEVTPDQLVLMLAGAYRLPGARDDLYTLRALLLDRDRRPRHLDHPLLFELPSAPVVAAATTPVSPWTRRVQRTFDHPEERPEIVATEPPCDDDFLIAVPPDGPLTDGADISA